MNCSKNQRGIAPILFLLAAAGIVIFTIIAVTASFKKAPYNNLYKKPGSNANSLVMFIDDQGSQITQTTTPAVKVALNAPWPVQGTVAPSPTADPRVENMRASVTYQVNKTNFQVGEDIPVRVMVKAEQDFINLAAVDLEYDPQTLEVVSIDKTNSFVTLWVENSDHATGSSKNAVTLIGGVPTPGIKTSGSDILMATVIFRGKTARTTDIMPGAKPAIYRNSDNENIYDTRIDPSIYSLVISDSMASPTPAPSGSPVASATPTPTPLSTPTPVPTTVPIGNCHLTSAAWLTTNFQQIEKRVVLLKAVGDSGCNGQQVSFSVKQSDPGGVFQFAKKMPVNSTFISGTAQSAWVTEYVPDILGLADPPEYFFTTNIVGTTQSVDSPDPKLEVAKYVGGNILKGDGNKDGVVDKTVDVSVLLTNFRKSADFPNEIDIIEDGNIDIQDFSGLVLILKSYNLLDASARLGGSNLAERIGIDFVKKVSADGTFTQAVQLAEDSNFTQNVVNVSYDVAPKITGYTFSDSQPGIKTIFVKFSPSDGSTPVISSETVNLINSNPTATPTAGATATPTPVPTVAATATPMPSPTPLPTMAGTPVIFLSGPSAFNITESSADIRFVTDVCPASYSVSGTTITLPLGCNITSFNIPLTGLTPGTQITITIQLAAFTGQITTKSATFTTTAP